MTTALVISTAVFALLHVPTYLDAEYPLLGMVVMWLLLGGLLGLSYALTGRLGMPMGLHFTVNLAINNLFGLYGDAEDTAQILHTETVGHAALADIGGVVHIGVIVLGYVAMVWWARRRPQGLAFAEGLADPPHIAGEDTPREPQQPGQPRHRKRALR